jgi:hypothetical protein
VGIGFWVLVWSGLESERFLGKDGMDQDGMGLRVCSN